MQEYQDFREEVQTFLAEKPTQEILDAGRNTTSAFAPFKPVMAWQKMLHDQGWAAPAWPKEFGGTGWDIQQRYIFAEECNRRRVPPLLPQNIQMIGPALIGFGNPEQQQRYLPLISSGEEFWCQGYSEPGAGSDLASLKCRAEVRGDTLVLNGSKTWTTYAQHADQMFALVRTDSSGKPQSGISFVLLDMSSDGIDVRPMIGLDGEPEQCEVFFSDVQVPITNVVGELNDGWTVAKYLLEFERGGSFYGAWLAPAFERLLKTAKSTEYHGRALIDREGVRRQLAELQIQIQAVKHTELRVNAKLHHGAAPGPDASMLKILGTEVQQMFSEVQLKIAGHEALPRGSANDADAQPMPNFGTAMPYYLNTRAASIYAGTNEIQRSLVAKAILTSSARISS